jgi:iron complex outermembrane receptor protein
LTSAGRGRLLCPVFESRAAWRWSHDGEVEMSRDILLVGGVGLDSAETVFRTLSQSFGSNRYTRTFLRYNTGDTGPVRSWVSYSNNQADQWRGDGQSTVTKIDAKSAWTLDEGDAITGSVQYNRKVTNNYRNLTKAQIAANGYDFGYVAAYKSADPSDWVGTRVNPFRSWTASLDGEFTLSDSLHLSVVPYFVYGYGGGGYGYAKTYVFYTFDTFRPGLHVKFKQDVGMNDSLEYGALAERPREQAANVFLPADPQGNPADLWGHDSRYYYKNANGAARRSPIASTRPRPPTASSPPIPGRPTISGR